MKEKEHKEERGKNYIPPRLEITMVEMENGISASSALVSPSSPPATDWAGQDDQTETIIWD
ncbi:hypothetical protein CMT56_13470 [Elizabethkingia anophelis]|uniref:Uncharacterized protein n=1 Tax=Elizabethkingia anophelis TaxID=1117645 RepID=A0AAU8US87_9FLAO|nr:hypothetical protein [Elizabethkingia anophelis]AQX00307.1 hypothetical protein BBD32_01925 [Elizabethkingia anophelis]MCT3719558.1 hypothetical protein [Elizabethkingia anophelis]MCT3723068.1 hypothetical protein [Elizabethkingia anophelis]MCT3788254.1 hypothetical protein [Elizabethkingia anophelis]MCT3960069.1 hypothetical protein [Elizabethkingia anophelis]